MRQKGTIWLAAATLLVAAMALWVSSDFGGDFGGGDEAGIGQPLFPDFRSRLGDITGIHLKSRSSEVTLARVEGQWRIAERADYKADTAKVRTYLRSVDRAMRRERKTSLPAKFERIGLGGSAVQIEISATGGESLAVFRTGSSVSRGTERESWTFILVDGEETSWLVDQLVVSDISPTSWLEKKIIDISYRRFSSVDITPASGEAFTLTGDGPIPGEIFVRDLREGEAASAPTLARSTAMALDGLWLQDVALRVSVSGLQLSELVYRMSDGLVVRAVLSEDADGRRWLTLDASYDEARAADPDGPSQMPDAPADGKAEAEGLNGEWRRWAYQISAIEADKLVSLRSDLITSDTDAEQQSN